MPTEADYQELAALNIRFSQTPAGKARRQYLDASAKIPRFEECLRMSREQAAVALTEFNAALAANPADAALFQEIRAKAAQITFPKIAALDEIGQMGFPAIPLEAEEPVLPSRISGPFPSEN